MTKHLMHVPEMRLVPLIRPDVPDELVAAYDQCSAILGLTIDVDVLARLCILDKPLVVVAIFEDPLKL